MYVEFGDEILIFAVLEQWLLQPKRKLNPVLFNSFLNYTQASGNIVM